MAGSNDSSTPSARRLWVIMFDTLVLPDPDRAHPDSTGDGPLAVSFNAFDDLEVRSTCFEQFVVQNVKAAASECDRFGGRDGVLSLIQSLQKSGQAVMIAELLPSCVDVSSQSQNSVDSAEDGTITSLAHGLGIKATRVVVDAGPDLAEQLPSDVIANAASACLVWFSVRNQQVSQSAEFRERVLSQILKCHDSLPVAERPVLLVTALCGEARELHAPLESSIDEGLIRVPLWIDVGRQHARRVQSLAGSFDIMPTIADLLACPVEHSAPTESAVATRPHSLMPLCGVLAEAANVIATASDLPALSPVVSPLRDQLERRVLRIAGDGWTGLRAQQYQLIHGAVVDADQQDYEPDDTRQLFLKPDDMWNVSDAIVTYEIIADEMESQAG